MSLVLIVAGCFVLIVAGCVVWVSSSVNNDIMEYLPEMVGDICYNDKDGALSFTGAVSGKRMTFFGSGTVWRHEDGRRADVITEKRVTDIMAKYRRDEGGE